jgi:hypothetical protein
MTTTSRPRVAKVHPEGIPDELKQGNQFVVLRLGKPRADGKRPKEPYDPKDHFERASSDDPSTWGTFEQAIAAYAEPLNKLHGIGRMFAVDDQLVGIDIDGCYDPATRMFTPESRAMIDRLDSYTEFSLSGTGVHIFACGSIPTGRNFRAHSVEMYGRNDHRYLTLTGQHPRGTPRTVNDRAAEVTALYNELNASTRTNGRSSHRGGCGGGAAPHKGEDPNSNPNQERSNGREYPHIEAAELPADFLRTIRRQNPKLARRIETHDGAINAGAATTAHDNTKVDRSGNDFYIACELRRLGYSPESVAAVLSHPTWFSGHKSRQRGAQYVDKTIAEARR